MPSALFNFSFQDKAGILLAAVPALLNLCICIYTLAFLPRNKLSYTFAAFVFAVMAWQCNDVMVRVSATAQTAQMWNRILSVEVLFISPLGLHFTLLFRERRKILKSVFFMFFLYAPVLFFISLFRLERTTLPLHYNPLWGWMPGMSNSRILFYEGLWVAGLAFAIFILLLNYAWNVRNNADKRTQALLLAIGFAIPTLQGTFTQIIMPFFMKLPAIPVSSTFMSAFSIAAFIALRKYHLFEISPLVAAQKIITTVSDILIITSNNGYLKFINPAGQDILGIKTNYIESLPISDFILEQNYDDFRFKMEEVIREQKNVENYMATMVTYDKKRITVLTSITPIMDNGVTEGILILAHNMMETIKNREELQNQKNLYQTLINTQSEMGEGVSITDQEKILYVNDAICNIYGYSREEILGFPSMMIIIPDEEKPILRERLRQRTKGERQENAGETKIIRKDGKIIDVEYSVRNIEMNGRMQAISIIRDITEKKRKDILLRQEKERAESAEIARKVGEQFLANMSHEIRTPMNAIVGFTGIMLNTPLTPEQRRYLEAIKISGDNLLVIINDILDLTRMRSGKVPIEQRPFKLSRTISMATEMMLPKASEGKIGLSAHIDTNVPDNLIGDRIRLNQILINLISNAIKFTAKGEVTIDVVLLPEEKHAQGYASLLISVKDTGIGIPKDKIDTIFEPFVQADSQTARRYGGTGLGLAIVKQLVELQGGSISVSSEEGKGSSFFFSINYKIATAELLTVAGSLTPPPVQPRNIKKLNVLLVDDDEMNQLVEQKIFGDWGWSTEVAENGMIAIEKLISKDFDIILMDIQMPEMDGYETTRRIRNELTSPKCNTPIIAMTACIMPEEEEKCYQSGMNGYISKPLDTQTLYARITSALKST